MKVGIGIAVVLGLAMVLLSTVWSSISGARSSWTDEKATRSADVKARLPYLGAIVNSPGKHSAAEVQKAKAEFDTLMAENQQLNEEFTAAAETPHTTAKILKWGGIALACVGLVGWYAVNQSN